MKRVNSSVRAAHVSMAVQYTCGAKNIPSRSQLRRWAQAAAETDIAFGLRFVDRTEGQALNQGYRNKNYATNVLTFIYDTGMPITGDIAICAEVIAEEAKAQKKMLKHHYAHMVIHGVLHLQGYDHERVRDAKMMEERERALLARFKIPDPYG